MTSPQAQVQAQAPAVAQTCSAYLFVHFTGEAGPDEEQVYFSVSAGSTPLDWLPLNAGEPVLRSSLGTRGVRDPFILRSVEGGRFFLLATDLQVYGVGDFVAAQEHGSRCLNVWESADLVHWSEQRQVVVSPEAAGNTWAPEAIWAPEVDAYVVYWASNLYPDSTERDVRDSHNRMLYAVTRDFVTFSEPRVWIDVRRGAGHGTIDSTVVRHEGFYYRFTKDERPDVMQVFVERSPELLRPTHERIGSSWELLGERLGADHLSHGEGPIVVPSLTGEGWYLLQDWPPYGGGPGYQLFESDRLGSDSWTPTPGATLPGTLRHGSVLPITQAERERLVAAYPPRD